MIVGIGLFLGLSNQVFCFDLSDEIYNSFKKNYDKGVSNDYLNSSYSSKYSKDPFGDILSTIEDMSKQPAVAGAQYVEDELNAKNCHLKKKKIWGILYYFVPDFRKEISRSVKMNAGDKKSKNFVFEESTIQEYCEEYYKCTHPKTDEEYETVFLGIRKYKITAAEPQDIMTNCKEFFVSTYKKGSENEKRQQGVKSAQAGSDQFRNASTDDSPYDIMTDFNNIGKLLYDDVSQPITPVFYNLPVFSNSTKSLSESQNKNSGAGQQGGNSNSNGNPVNKNGGGSSGSITKTGSFQILGGNNRLPQGSGNKPFTGTTSTTSPTNTGSGSITNLPVQSELIEDIYDELVEGLGSRSLVDKGTLFYGSLCEDDDVQLEPEGYIPSNNGGNNSSITPNEAGNELPILTDEEYQEIIDYMLSSVDQYTALPDDKKLEILNLASNTNRGNSSTTPDDMDNAAEEIKTCRKSCEGLRVDQMASCMMMCACDEITSADESRNLFGLEIENPAKLFDSNEFPGLGPIAIIRFCTVPGVDMSFSKGGKKVMSIEEGSKEILGVVDKLSREGKLGIWTQQNNFLDSTTKKIKIKDTVAFSISVEKVDPFDKFNKESGQYTEMLLKNNNTSRQRSYDISNPLTDPSQKNKYSIVGYVGEQIQDYRGQIDASYVRESQTDINKSSSFSIDQIADSHADRYISISSDLNEFGNQQANLWKLMQNYMENLTQYAKSLYSKKS